MKLIATDLDRTLIPNGHRKLSDGAMELFKKELKKNKVGLIYVTGRTNKLIIDAISRYDLPEPSFCIALGGVIVYEYKSGKLVEIDEWQDYLKKNCPGCERENISKILRDINGIDEQPKRFLHRFKQSYYVDLNSRPDRTVKKVKSRMKRMNLDVEVIYSVDVKRNIGLIDIVPREGTKLTALNFVLKKIKVKKDNVMYSGDSGNDLIPLTSGFFGVLVNNASDDVKKNVKKILLERRLEKKFHFSEGFEKFNGNYVSGILEGAYRFGFFNRSKSVL